MKIGKNEKDELLFSNSINPTDGEYRELVDMLTSLEHTLDGLLGEEGKRVLEQHKRIQNQMYQYLLIKGVETGIQSIQLTENQANHFIENTEYMQ